MEKTAQDFGDVVELPKVTLPSFDNAPGATITARTVEARIAVHQYDQRTRMCSIITN